MTDRVLEPWEHPSYGRFLELFPREWRGTAANIFYEAARGLRDRNPQEVLRATVALATKRQAEALEWGNTDKMQKLALFLRMLKEREKLALVFCARVVSWEQLPHDKREELKAERGRIYAMEGKPATEKQVAYLRKLGYQDDVKDRAEASRLIDQLRSQQAAS